MISTNSLTYIESNNINIQVACNVQIVKASAFEITESNYKKNRREVSNEKITTEHVKSISPETCFKAKLFVVL